MAKLQRTTMSSINDRNEPAEELRDALAPASPVINRPSSWWTPSYVIDIVSATQEIIAWAEDKREFSTKHRPAWSSVIDDYFFARNEPVAVANGCFPAFNALDAAVQRLRASLPAAGNGVPIESSILNLVVTSARHVMHELQEPASLREAFDALLSAVESSVTTSTQLSTERDFFWRLVELQGLSYQEISEALLGILDDDRYQIQKVQVLLGDRGEPPTAKYGEVIPAGFSWESKLDLCRRMLSARTPECTHAVWLAYQYAHLESVSMQVGPVVFYMGRFVKGIATCESVPDHHVGKLPAELLADRDRFARNLIEGDDDGDIVYVRVDLGSGRYSDSVRVARQVAQSVVTLASFTANTGHWQLCDGFLQVVNNALTWTSAFSKRFNSIPTIAEMDPTPVALGELSRKLDHNLSGSIMGTDDWSKLLDLLHWRERAKESDPTSRIVLDVRVIETVSGWVGYSNWRRYLDHYHRLSWIRTQINTGIARIGHDATHPYWNASVENRRRLRELNRLFIDDKGYGRIETNIKIISTSLDEILSLLPIETRVRRGVVTLRSRLASIDNLRKAYASLSRQWDLTLDRAQRIRNSLAHGGPVNETAAISVSQFIRTLSGWSVWIAMEATMASEEVLDAHDSWKRADDAWKSRIDSSDSALAALFPN